MTKSKRSPLLPAVLWPTSHPPSPVRESSRGSLGTFSLSHNVTAIFCSLSGWPSPVLTVANSGPVRTEIRLLADWLCIAPYLYHIFTMLPPLWLISHTQILFWQKIFLFIQNIFRLNSPPDLTDCIAWLSSVYYKNDICWLNSGVSVPPSPSPLPSQLGNKNW